MWRTEAGRNPRDSSNKSPNCCTELIREFIVVNFGARAY